jgi:hypothetical protein
MRLLVVFWMSAPREAVLKNVAKNMKSEADSVFRPRP